MLPSFVCSSNGKKINDGMRLIIATFVGIVIGFFLGISFPTLSLTKVSYIFTLSLFIFSLMTLCLVAYCVFSCAQLELFQINFPSSILPSVDIAYVEDETPETSSETLLHTWSSRSPLHGGNSSDAPHWKV